MIRVHDGPSVLMVDVGGPATMAESPAVIDIANERIAGGVRAVRIDLRDCTIMDSTFSGTLLALERQLGKLGGSLTLVSPSPRVVELLEQMGVEDFYAIEASDRVDGPWSVLTPARPPVDKLRRVVIDAHDELANLPVAQADAFRGVVEELRKTPESDATTSKKIDDDEGPARRNGPEPMRTAGLGAETIAH